MVKKTFVLFSRILADGWQIAKGSRLKILLGGIIVLIVAWFAAHSGFDRSCLDAMTQNRPEATIRFAQKLSNWGELHLAPFAFMGGLALIGLLARKINWCYAAAAGFLASLSAGLSALILKMFFGRPRPKMNVTDVLHGFTLDHHFQSFPSGHSTHCWAPVIAIAMVNPRWGVFFSIPAAAVMWSRMYLLNHYPGDVFAGAALGTLFGICIGLATRRLLQQNHSTSQS